LTKAPRLLPATAAAVVLALLLFFSGYQDLIYDAWGYSELARRISRAGLMGAANEWRTYGYPLFVALCNAFHPGGTRAVRAIVFAVQLALYLGACAFGGRVLGRAFGSERFGRRVYVAGALNPFLLARTTECLSDLLSAVLVYAAVLLAIPRREPPEDAPLVARRAALSLAAAAFASVVRPSSVAVLAALAVLWIARQALWRELRPLALAGILAAVVLPFVPQVAVNARAFGKPTPLVVESLYAKQVGWGMSGLKYGSLVISGEAPQVEYRNPLYRGEASLAEFATRRPAAYAATLGLHLFAMFDQDFLFTYPTAPHPWYRWPVSVLNYAFLFLVLAGVAVFLARARRAERDRAATFAGFALILAAAASVALYVPTLVESRFAAPAQILMTPFLIVALEAAGRWRAERRWNALAAAGIAAAVFIACAAALSAWISAQAPRLRRADSGRYGELTPGRARQPVLAANIDSGVYK
jgi:hypothetical protein